MLRVFILFIVTAHALRSISVYDEPDAMANGIVDEMITRSPDANTFQRLLADFEKREQRRRERHNSMAAYYGRGSVWDYYIRESNIFYDKLLKKVQTLAIEKIKQFN